MQKNKAWGTMALVIQWRLSRINIVHRALSQISIGIS